MKYKLTEETREINGITLYRIEATSSFGDVKEGDLGGWVENSKNLSKRRWAWIAGEAAVYGEARVGGDAWIGGNAEVYERASIGVRAKVSGNAKVYGNACVADDAVVTDYAKVSGFTQVLGCVCIMNHASVSGDIRLLGSIKFGTNTQLTGQFAIIEQTGTVLHIDGNAPYLPNLQRIAHIARMCDEAPSHIDLQSADWPYWHEPIRPAPEVIHREPLSYERTIPDLLLSSLKEALMDVQDPRKSTPRFQPSTILSLAFIAALRGAKETSQIDDFIPSLSLTVKQSHWLGLPPPHHRTLERAMPPSSAYSRLHGVIDMKSVNRILRQWLKDHRYELPGQMAPATPFMDETLKSLTHMFRRDRASAGKAKLSDGTQPKQDSHNQPRASE